MRFLLKRVVGVGKNRATAKKRLDTSTTKATAQSQSWGQQCGISCGCVLRIETQLSESSTSISPTIVSATYHAKRVLATSNNNDNGGIYLKPLTTQHKSNNSQPILSSCTTCPTLHQLATQTVEYLPGKTLDQVRNHIENGIVTTRSSLALRHTILRENILPAIEEENSKKKLGTAKKSSSIQQLKKNHEVNTKKNGRHEMKHLTNQYVHCYDLVEDALSSMIHERMPSPRSNINREADFYSITLGSYFAMYDTSNSKRRRRQHIDSIDYLQRPDNDMNDEEKLSAQANDWQRESPSSVFLFGDEHVVQSNNNTMSGYIYQYIKESINNQFAGNDKTIEGESQTEQTAPTTTYLQLLDMYSEVDVDDDTQKDAKDDWLMHVDEMSSTA